MFYNSISRELFPVFLRMVFGGLSAFAMSSNSSCIKSALCLRLVVPRAASRDQHAAVKWCATQPAAGTGVGLRGSIIDATDRTPLFLALIVRLLVVVIVPVPMLRAGQSERVDFVISGSDDFPVTRSPKEHAVYDRWPINY